MFSSVKTWLTISAVVAVLGFVGYKEYQTRSLKTEVALLEANSAVLGNALKDSNEAFNLLKAEHDKIQKLYEDTVIEFRKVDENNRYARDRIENVVIDEDAVDEINKIFAEAMRCMELASGSELTQIEKEASSAEEFNSVCPHYYVAGGVQ